MQENSNSLLKLLGISLILIGLWVYMIYTVPESFLSSGNLENLLRRTALFSILGIGVALVIMTGGIDLSLGSMVALAGCFLALFLRVDYEPFHSESVYELNKRDSMLLSSYSNEYQNGQWLRIYQTKRNYSSNFEVVAINQALSHSTGTTTGVQLASAPGRDEVSEDDSPIAKLAIAYPIQKVGLVESDSRQGADASEASGSGTKTWMEVDLELAKASDIRPRDRVWLIGLDGKYKEQSVTEVAAVAGGVRLGLDLDASIEAEQWRWIPVRRKQRMSVTAAIVSVLGIAVALGALHGILVTAMNLQPFVVTLCGLLVYRGWSRGLSNDQSVGFGTEYVDSLTWFSTGRFEVTLPLSSPYSFGIPYAFLVMMVLAIAAAVLLNLTIWGRYFRAIGRNEEAAQFSGINTSRVRLLVYTLCGGLAGVCGILFAIESGSISPSNSGSYFELYAIAAAVLGGCSLRGGEGSILGVIIGTALMQTIGNLIMLSGIPNSIEMIVLGGIILLAVVVDEVIRRWLSRVRAG